MKINLHVDASISEEHAEIWVKQMKPNLESMLQYLNNIKRKQEGRNENQLTCRCIH